MGSNATCVQATLRKGVEGKRVYELKKLENSATEKKTDGSLCYRPLRTPPHPCLSAMSFIGQSMKHLHCRTFYKHYYCRKIMYDIQAYRNNIIWTCLVPYKVGYDYFKMPLKRLSVPARLPLPHSSTGTSCMSYSFA